jgi:plastocyanin
MHLRLQHLTFMLPLIVGACGGDTDTSTPTTGDPTTHTVSTELMNMDFMPEDMTIAVGDIVRFEMTSDHNAVEVSMEDYDARNPVPLAGGFDVTFGETAEITFEEAGVYYYVCQPHVLLDMIGTITVE